MSDAAAVYIQDMLAFAREAGRVALAYINDSAPGLKPDASIITKADTAISALARQHLAHHLNQPGHVLLDEEDPDLLKYFNQELLDTTPFLWSIDPIDGTRLYANHMPLFGISLGLIKDAKPWLGVVYFPMLDELFYCDGEAAYFVKNAFHVVEQKVRIMPNAEALSPKSIFFCNDTFFEKFYWLDKDFHIMIHACAVVNLCWPTIGRGIGCFQRCYLWDFAGSWPIIQHAGFQLRRVSDGVILEKVDVALFTGAPKPWQMKEYYLISTEANFAQIRSRIGRLPPPSQM